MCFNWQARLSDDSKYVIFIDRQDGSLHVVELNVKTVDNSWSHRQVASCFTHAPSRTRLSLRCGGRVVLICDGSIVLSMLAIKDGGANETDEAIEYSGETQRAASILRICSQRSAALVQTLTLNTILSKERTAETPLSDRRPLSSMRKLLPLADIKTLPSASAGIP